jgi:hypothetical protein
VRPKLKLSATTFLAIVLVGCAGTSTPPTIYGRMLMNGYLVPTQLDRYPVVKMAPAGGGVVLLSTNGKMFDCSVTRKGALDVT